MLLYLAETLNYIRLARNTKLELFSLNYKPYIKGSIIYQSQGTKVLGYKSSMNCVYTLHSVANM